MKVVNVHSHFPSETEITVLQETTNATTRFSSLGVHPVLDAENAAEKLKIVEETASERKIVAIGESGFDKNSSLSTEQQINIFRAQMALSEQTGLPVIIHCVGRWNELEMIFKEKKADSPPWIIHGFRKMKLAQKFLDLGAYLSFGEALLYDETIHKAIVDIPLEKVFLETDDKEFEINTIYEKLAKLKKISTDQIISRINQNFQLVFKTKVV